MDHPVSSTTSIWISERILRYSSSTANYASKSNKNFWLRLVHLNKIKKKENDSARLVVREVAVSYIIASQKTKYIVIVVNLSTFSVSFFVKYEKLQYSKH